MVGLKANHQSTAVPSPNNGARMPLPKSGAAANLDLVGPLEFPDVDLGETSIKNRIWTYGRKNGCLEPRAVVFFFFGNFWKGTWRTLPFSSISKNGTWAKKCVFFDKLTFTMLMDFQKRNILEMIDGGFPCQQPPKHHALFMFFFCQFIRLIGETCCRLSR